MYTTLKIALSMKQKGIVPNCTSVAVGRYYLLSDLFSSYNIDFDVSPFAFVTYHGFYNTGYAFNRTIYNAIIDNWDLFQKFDPDWDTSLAGGLMEQGHLGFEQVRRIHITNRLLPIWQEYIISEKKDCTAIKCISDCKEMESILFRQNIIKTGHK